MESNIHWEKIGIYMALMVGFLTVIFYIADMKERLSAAEVRIEHLIEERRK